jgi:hypothetical protein
VKSGGRFGRKDAWTALALVLAVGWFFAPLLRGEAIVAEPDALAALLPLKMFLARCFARGEWPLWNPDAALGKPFLPDLLAGALYPPNLLLAIPPFARGLNLLFVGHYAFTALGALLWLRAAGLPRLAALLGALVWTFGGTMISMGNVLNQLLSAAWLPWVLWAWLRPHALATKIALSTLAMALALMAGGPEMVLVAATALVLTSRHPASLLVPPLAFAVAAVELLPFFHYLMETWRGTQGIDATTAMRYSIPPADLVQLARDARQASPERFMPQIYVGPGVLALALLGLVTARRTMLAFWGVVAVGSILVVLGSYTPVYPFLYVHLPLSNLLRYPEKLFLGVHALIAGGAAFGAAAIVAALARVATTPLVRRASVLLGVSLCVIVFGDLARANRAALYAPRPDVVLDPPASARAIVADDAARRTAEGASEVAHAPRVYTNERGRPIPRSLPAAVALDRSLPWGAVGELYGLANVNAPSSLNLVKHEWLQQAMGGVPRATALGALAALGTRYVTSWVALDEAPDASRVPVPDERIGVKLYALADVQPRAYIARRVRAADDAHQALQRFVEGDGSVHLGLALVRRGDVPPAAFEEGPGTAIAATALVPADMDAVGAPEGETARVVVDRGHALDIEATLQRPGLLVLNDTMLAGWTATIDGVSAPLIEVNGLVRGVWLAAGPHRVSMRYVPPGLVMGGLVSLAALLVTGGLAWLGRRRTLRALAFTVPPPLVHVER